jgi:hypothetical protein
MAKVFGEIQSLAAGGLTAEPKSSGAGGAPAPQSPRSPPPQVRVRVRIMKES